MNRKYVNDFFSRSNHWPRQVNGDCSATHLQFFMLYSFLFISFYLPFSQTSQLICSWILYIIQHSFRPAYLKDPVTYLANTQNVSLKWFLLWPQIYQLSFPSDMEFRYGRYDNFSQSKGHKSQNSYHNFWYCIYLITHFKLPIQKLSYSNNQIQPVNHSQIPFILNPNMSLQDPWLQKLNQFKKLEKTHIMHYTILKTLKEAIEEQEKLPFHTLYQSTLKSLPKEIRELTLCKQLIHNIWINDSYPIHVREECCHEVLKTVTQWIMEFEIKVDRVKNVSDKFRLVKEFIQTNCKQIEMTLLVVDQIFEDLKDLLDQSFWDLPGENIDTCNEYTFVAEADEDTPQELIGLLELILYREVEPVRASNQSDPEFYLSTSHNFASENYEEFLSKCINYLLCLELSQSHQSQATKLALEFIRSRYCLQNQSKTIKLFQRLMLRTKKAVRYAMVEQYIETYKFFQSLHLDQVIEQLEDMVYFRELIVGHAKVQTSHGKVLEDNLSLSYFSEILVKAGSKQRIYFAVEDCSKAILKLEMILEEGMDINMKIYQLNAGQKEVLYHEEAKTELRKLDLKINYMGLYALEFDNTYSWIHGKKILTNLHIMKKVDLMEELTGQKGT